MNLGGVDFEDDINRQELQTDLVPSTIVVTISLALEFVRSRAR
jgi:hypothetical protein